MSLYEQFPGVPNEDYDINVKTLTGKNIRIHVTSRMTVATLKNAIAKKERIPADQQRLVFNGKPMEDHKTLEYYGVDEGRCHKVWSRGGGNRVTKTIGWKTLGYQTPSSDKHVP